MMTLSALKLPVLFTAFAIAAFSQDSLAAKTCEDYFSNSNNALALSPSREVRVLSNGTNPEIAQNDILIASLDFNDPQFLAAYFRKHYEKGDAIREILKRDGGLFGSELFLKRFSMVISDVELDQTEWSLDTMTSLAERMIQQFKSDLATERGNQPLSMLDADLLAKKITESVNKGVDPRFNYSAQQFQSMRAQYIALSTGEQGEKFLKALILHSIDKIQDYFELLVLQQRRRNLIEEQRTVIENRINGNEIQNIWASESTGLPHVGRWIVSLATTGSAVVMGPFTPEAFFAIETALILPTFGFFHALWPYTPWNGKVLRFINDRVADTRQFYRNRITAPIMRRITERRARKLLARSARTAIASAADENINPNDIPELSPPPADEAINYQVISAEEIEQIPVNLEGELANNPFEVSLLGEQIPSIVNHLKLEAGDVYMNGMSTNPELFTFVQSFSDKESVKALNLSTMMQVSGILERRREFVINHIRQLSSVFSRLGSLKLKAQELKEFFKEKVNSDNENVAESAKLGLEFVEKYEQQIQKAEAAFVEMQANLNLQRDIVERFQDSFNPANPEVSTTTAEILVELREAIMRSIR